MTINVNYAIAFDGSTSMITYIDDEKYHQIFDTPSEAFSVVQEFLKQFDDAKVIWNLDGFVEESFFDKPKHVTHVEENVVHVNF